MTSTLGVLARCVTENKERWGRVGRCLCTGGRGGGGVKSQAASLWISQFTLDFADLTAKHALFLEAAKVERHKVKWETNPTEETDQI